MARPVASSFTERVLAEVAPHVPPLQCCRYALIDGMRLATPALDGEPRLLLSTPRSVTARAAMQALGALRLVAHVEKVSAARRARFVVVGNQPWQDGRHTGRACCSRTLLRGALLAGGSVARPGRAPQAEIVCASQPAAAELRRAAAVLDLPVTLIRRRGRTVAVVHSAGGVAALLSSVGAQAARLAFEEGRVESEVRASVNRRINAETANLRRTVLAGLRQLAAAERLRQDATRWHTLPPALREAAELRTRHPRESLEQLAERAAVSRSAMAGRLHRLVALAGMERRAALSGPVRRRTV